MVVGDGFEPSKDVLADLQSAPFGHSGIPPLEYGAGKGGRTPLTSLEGWCTAVMPYPQIFLPTAYRKLVPTVGVEPTSLAAHGPEPCASANSATSAFINHNNPLRDCCIHKIIHVFCFSSSFFKKKTKKIKNCYCVI